MENLDFCLHWRIGDGGALKTVPQGLIVEHDVRWPSGSPRAHGCPVENETVSHRNFHATLSRLSADFRCRRVQLAKLTRPPQKLLCSRIVTLRTTDNRKVEQTAEFMNALFQAPFEFATGDLRLAFSLMNHAQVIVGHYVFRRQGRRKLEVLSGFCQLSLVKQRQSKPVVGGVVVGTNIETAAEGGGGLRHVAPVVVGDPEIVVGQNKNRRGFQRPVIVFDGLVQQPFVEQKVSELVVTQNVVGLGVEQVLELLPCLPPPSLAFMHQGQKKPLVNRSVTKKSSALGAELVRRCAQLTAAGTTYGALNHF